MMFYLNVQDDNDDVWKFDETPRSENENVLRGREVPKNAKNRNEQKFSKFYKLTT